MVKDRTLMVLKNGSKILETMVAYEKRGLQVIEEIFEHHSGEARA